MLPFAHLGLSRSSLRREHLLHSPDAFVRTPLPGLRNGAAIVHVAPAMGAAFAMLSVELDSGGTLTEGPAQRFMYVLEGRLTLSYGAAAEPRMLEPRTPEPRRPEPRTPEPRILGPGSYAYLPGGCPHVFTALTSARCVLFEKSYTPLASQHREGSVPEVLFGEEAEVLATALNGDADLQVRSLLPASAAYDFACNTMTYAPGASLGQVEVHSMEHGLIMLSGGGIYRLGENWYPTVAGDAIWMGPFCPQWFGALGREPTKYLIYKDWNRHVLA